MEKINIDSWKRKEHFEFFSSMASPSFGIVSEVDCTKTYDQAKAAGESFFARYLHKSMTAVNRIPEFRYRIIAGGVYELDMIHAGATIGRNDGTFAFIFVHYSADFKIFNQELQKEIKEVQNSTGLRMNDDHRKQDLIRYSTLPWITFTALLHPTNFNKNDAVPRITFGKFTERDGRKYLPVSVEAHHGLMDGFHVAEYLKEFQALLNE